MNKWVKRKWVRALRSGGYRQTQRWTIIKEDDGSLGYCCLGVLACEMAPEFIRPHPYNEEAFGIDGKTTILPDDFAILLGLSQNAQSTLASLNDEGKTFDEIADYIEENL